MARLCLLAGLAVGFAFGLTSLSSSEPRGVETTGFQFAAR